MQLLRPQLTFFNHLRTFSQCVKSACACHDISDTIHLVSNFSFFMVWLSLHGIYRWMPGIKVGIWNGSRVSYHSHQHTSVTLSVYPR